MKLKLVVASMSVLGLISCPTFAATQHHKHKHAAQTVRTEYKDMGALPVIVCPINDPYTETLDVLDHNFGRAKPTEDCTKLISFAGGINFDTHWGNRSMGYEGENVQRASLNDAYLNIFGNVNDWVKAFASLSYSNTTSNSAFPYSVFLPGTSVTATKNGQYSNVYTNERLNLEQGFIRVANFDQTPFFLQIGKQFIPFGIYNIHPIERSMTQVLSETLATSAEAGFITQMGFHGTISAFDDTLRQRNSYALTTVQGHTHTNYSASLGFDHMSDPALMFGVNLSYLYDMSSVGDITQAISQYQSFGFSNTNGSYHNRVAGGAIDAMIGSGPFSLIGDYVSALSTFNNNDLNSRGMSVVVPGTGSGAKPWAGNLQAGYNFNAWSKNQNIYLGYQASGDAVNIFLPKNRWLAGYNVDVWKMTNLGLEVGHDTDYGVSKGGTGDSSNTIALRAGVQFG